MPYHLKIHGKTRRSLKDPWKDVTCFVVYSDPDCHREIVEDSFQYHLNLDLDDLKQHYPDHFSAPHNVCRAILLYHHFRERHQFFHDDHWEYIKPSALPNRAPDAEGTDYKLWIEGDIE